MILIASGVKGRKEGSLSNKYLWVSRCPQIAIGTWGRIHEGDEFYPFEIFAKLGKDHLTYKVKYQKQFNTFKYWKESYWY